jgi:putative ABC transport system ATP-binding protein
MMEAVRARGLWKTYRQGGQEISALRDVDLEIEPGKVVALLGPSGSGKSTLIKVLGLVTPPDRGSIVFAGQTVLANGTALVDAADLRRRYLGFVFQKSNLVSFLSARRNVELACEIGGVERPAGRAHDLLAQLGVLGRANAFPDELSGGEQQRVAIARALANRPSLLLADEPTAALDRERGRAVMELFRTVAHDHGAAVLVVTHDHRALDVFDELYDMEDGRLAAKHPPGQAPAVS